MDDNISVSGLKLLAAKDKSSAEWLFDGAHYPQAIYLLCQSLEKLIKASHLTKDKPELPRIHHLGRLARNSSLKFSHSQLVFLDSRSKQYQRVRYSDLAQQDFNTKRKTRPWMKKGDIIYSWIQQKLDQF